MADTPSAAQSRADDIAGFRRELDRLRTEGVLSLDEAQSRSVAGHHDALLAGYVQAFDIDRDMQTRQLSAGMRIASFLGAVALAASVFFLFHQFWGRFSTFGQVLILIGASLSSFWFTLWVQRRDASGYFTKLAVMVAFACFVLNIVMLGQIFNITPSDKALLAWAVFALLLAYRCSLRLLLVAGIVCIIGYVAARVGSWSGLYWIHFGERPENFFPVAIALFVLPQILSQERYAGFASVYRLSGLLALFLPVLALSHWGGLSYLSWSPDIIEGAYQLAGFALSAAVIWLGARRNWNEVVNTGITFFVVFLYTKFFDWWWDIMPKYLFFLVLGLTAVLLLVVLRRLRRGLLAAAQGTR